MNKKDVSNNGFPLVSVIILTRNRADSLARTLQSVNKLDYPNVEVVVVDNGSTDQTFQVASNFSAKYVFSPPSYGFSKSRQLGVETARGEIIAWCDDDCIPEPDWLQHFVKRLQSEDDLGLVGGQVINVGFNDTKQYKGRSKLARNGKLIFVANPQEAEFFGNLNMAVKRQAVQSIGGYDPFLKAGLEEIDLAMSLRRNGFRIEFEPAAVVRHFHTGVSYKRGRFFYDNHLMRLYFYLKHFQPHTLSAWLEFLRHELKLLHDDFIRLIRASGSAALRGKFKSFPGLCIELFNLVSARLVIPWLVWRARFRQPDKQKIR